MVERANENYITVNANSLNAIVAQFMCIVDAIGWWEIAWPYGYRRRPQAYGVTDNTILGRFTDTSFARHHVHGNDRARR